MEALDWRVPCRCFSVSLSISFFIVLFVPFRFFGPSFYSPFFCSFFSSSLFFLRLGFISSSDSLSGLVVVCLALTVELAFFIKGRIRILDEYSISFSSCF